MTRPENVPSSKSPTCGGTEEVPLEISDFPASPNGRRYVEFKEARTERIPCPDCQPEKPTPVVDVGELCKTVDMLGDRGHALARSDLIANVICQSIRQLADQLQEAREEARIQNVQWLHEIGERQKAEAERGKLQESYDYIHYEWEMACERATSSGHVEQDLLAENLRLREALARIQVNVATLRVAKQLACDTLSEEGANDE
jgi:hypothetical protein